MLIVKKLDILETRFILEFVFVKGMRRNALCWHLLLAGRAPWCPRPRCQWWSRGTAPHTAAGSALLVSLAAEAAQDGCWWRSRRKVWGFQNGLAARRNSWSPLTRSKQELFLFFIREQLKSASLSAHIQVDIKANVTSESLKSSMAKKTQLNYICHGFFFKNEHKVRALTSSAKAQQSPLIQSSLIQYSKYSSNSA